MKVKNSIIAGCLLILSFGSMKPLFSSGFFPMHDDAQVARVIVMARALKHGQFPVRIVADLGYGYGYPLFNFYGPLPYYVGGLIHLLGIDALTATKIMIGIGIITGTMAMYLCSSLVFGTLGGLVSAILFTYFPYRAVQLYVRGAVGELWAASFMPLLLFGILKITKKEVSGVYIAGLSIAAIILSHTVFGYISIGGIGGMVLLLYLFSILCHKKNLQSFGFSLFASMICALGITAFFWIPALTEMSFTNVQKVIGETADYKDHFVCLPQLWDSQWGFGGSAPGCADGLSFKLGKFHIFYFFLAILLWLFSKERERRLSIILISVVAASGLLIFFMLRASHGAWDALPLFSFIQYPWRFLGPLGVCMGFVPGYVLYKKKAIRGVILLSLIGGSIVILNHKLFSPQYLYSASGVTFGTTEELRWRASKVSDEYLPRGLIIPDTVSEVVSGRVIGNEYMKVTKLIETETEGVYEIIAGKDQKLKLNMAFYPGWTYSINGIYVKPEVVRGQPSVILSMGTSFLKMEFRNTPVRVLGNGISCAFLIGIVVYFFYGKKIISHHRYPGL